MIERKFVAQNLREFRIKEYVRESLNRAGLSSVSLKRTSLGDRIVIEAARPGLVVGRGGAVIQKLTSDLKGDFSLENPQIEIEEVQDINSNAAVVAESIVSQLERFGSARFKGIGHKTVERVMSTGALGVEILISGKIPSSRAKTWRFVAGYMKKCGDIAITGVDTAKQYACLKTGVVGIQVRIMPQTTVLPDKIVFSKNDKDVTPVVEEKEIEETTKQELEQEEVKLDQAKEEKKKPAKKKATKKKTSKSTSTSKDESSEDKSLESKEETVEEEKGEKQ